MYQAYLSGPEQPDRVIHAAPGQTTAGAAIGILVLDLWYPLFPGNVANASTFSFPVFYQLLEGAGVEILDADASLLDKIIDGGKKLQRHGVRAIVGACGYFGNYQKAAAAAFDQPVFLSSLLQVPMILNSLKPGQKVGIICAVKEALTPYILDQCGITDPDSVVVAGAEVIPEFMNIVNSKGAFNSAVLERELVALAQEMVAAHPEIGALLLECSDMPPYAWAIQNALGLPVFDFITLINWVQGAVVRRPFAGYI
jgi:hypothetical protein